MVMEGSTLDEMLRDGRRLQQAEGLALLVLDLKPGNTAALFAVQDAARGFLEHAAGCGPLVCNCKERTA